MPTVDEMANAYIEHCKQKILELEKQVTTLQGHVAECEQELESNSEESNDD